MHINITGKSRIRDVKKNFQAQFPDLKIEFFYHPHDAEEGSPKSDMVPDNLTLNEIRKKKTDGSVEFDEYVTIQDLEQILKDDFGLNIQVFRKAGSAWIETILTDYWTLKEAEDKAKEYSK